jgi:transposase
LKGASRVRRKAARKRPATARRRDLAAQPILFTDATTVFVMDTSRSAGVAAGQLGIDREQAALEAGRRLVISSDFHKAYQSLACIDGVDPLWCWAHIRRYFLRAGAAHPEALGDWCDAWTERIAVLYRAHHALAATTPGTDAREHAAGRWQRAFTDIDAHRILQASDAGKGLLHPAAAKVIATLNHEWDGLARHQDLPQLPLDNYADVSVMPRSGPGGGVSAGRGGGLAA